MSIRTQSAYLHLIDVRDGDEFADEVEAPEIEQEGYLFGKRMLDDLEEIDEPGAASACPFSGLVKGVSAVSVASGEGEASAVTQADGKETADASTKDPA